jgi:hypothetical protein
MNERWQISHRAYCRTNGTTVRLIGGTSASLGIRDSIWLSQRRHLIAGRQDQKRSAFRKRYATPEVRDELMQAGLCELSRKLPLLVADILSREGRLIRGSFSELTFTDLFAASFSAFAGKNLIISYPDEPATGGDIDLVFEDVGKRQRITLRIQAKRLSPARYRGKEQKLEIRAYKEVLHKVKGKLQLTTIAEDQSVTGLYAFYNHKEVVEHYTKSNPNVLGVSLAFATDLHRELVMSPITKGSAPLFARKRLTYLQKYFFRLEDIFCPLAPDLAKSEPPSLLQPLQKNLQDIFESRVGLSDAERVIRRLGQSYPLSHVEQLTYDTATSPGPPIRRERRERPRITILSGEASVAAAKA